MDFAARAAACAATVTPGGVVPVGTISACANWAAVAKRSAGTLASAFFTACSTASATLGRTARSEGAGSVKRRAIIACAVGPANGTAPASIS